jgi:hypothetical protein
VDGDIADSETFYLGWARRRVWNIKETDNELDTGLASPKYNGTISVYGHVFSEGYVFPSSSD